MARWSEKRNGIAHRWRYHCFFSIAITVTAALGVATRTPSPGSHETSMLSPPVNSTLNRITPVDSSADEIPALRIDAATATSRRSGFSRDPLAASRSEPDGVMADQLRDPDPLTRRLAAANLAELPGNADILMAVLHDPDPLVRLIVLEALGDDGSERADQVLLGAIYDPDRRVRLLALDLLSDREDDHARALLQLARTHP